MSDGEEFDKLDGNWVAEVPSHPEHYEGKNQPAHCRFLAISGGIRAFL